MRISYWISDVCSSDLDRQRLRRSNRDLPLGAAAARLRAVHRVLHRARDRAADARPPGAQGGQLMGAVANNAALRTADALYRRRKVTNAVSLVLACLAAGIGLLFLGWILWTLVSKGLGGINMALFTQDTPPPMSAGGLRNALFASAVMCLMATGIGTPLGIAAGTWLAEYGAASRIGTVVRFVNDILL